MLFMVPMFFLFRNIRIADTTMLLNLFSAVVIALGDILWKFTQGIDYHAVVDKRTNINGFAPIPLCLSGLLLLYCVYGSKNRFRWLALVGSVCGIVAVVFSKSRSSWVTTIVLVAMFSLRLARALPLWKRALAALLAPLLVATIYFSCPR